MTDAYPYRCGRLMGALELLLEVIDEQPTALDPCHALRVEQARRELADAESPAVTR